MAWLPRSELVAAILLAAIVAGTLCVSGQTNNPLGEVLGALASEWGNEDLASITCQDSPDILTCNDQDQVVALQLNGVANDPLVTIPAHIGNLTTLTYLSMVDNSLTGSVPESFSKLVLLQALDVSNNLITQPLNAIMTLTSLTYLNMSNNFISAPLPPGMSNLLSLEYLDLMSNSLDKVQALSSLTNLKYLRLEECWIEPAPLTIFAPLVALHYLNLFNNSFEGSLSGLTSLSRLEHLDLADNYIGPNIPSTLSQLSGLSYLDLSLNSLSGPIDPITSLTALQVLVLYTNPLSGSFPESISRLSRLTFLEISGTNFTATLPASLGQMTTLRHLGLDRTTMVGSLPASLGNLTRLTQLLFEPLSKTVGPRCGKEGACVVNQSAFTAFCAACPDFCLTCTLPGLCTGCKVSEPLQELPAGSNSSGSSGGGGSSGLSTGAIIGIVCGVVVLLLALLLAILFFLFRRKKVSRFGALAKGMCVEYTMKEMQQATNNWSEENLLGSGGYGDVYKGVSPDDGTTLWAVKRAKVITNDFQREVSEMASKHHPNLVRLLGYATCGDLRGRIEQILVYEFISNGDLHKWLGSDAPSPLTLRQRLDVIVGAARGFEYLHGFDIVHRDIKPANILLDSNMQPKVADFGLVRVEGGTTVQATRVMGTPGFVDPAYSHTHKATPATDVYSFGVLMLVVITGRHATFDEDSLLWNILDWVQEKLSQGAMDEIADPRMGPAPPDALQRMADLAVRCTATFTADRPSMGRIAQEMEALRAEVCGGEEEVNKSYKKVDAELREKMQHQSLINEDNLNDALESIPSSRVGDAGGTWGV
ncbi:unnamed protein product [Closterium sp. Yama58-4]|nr:unnamed protein product [Closterium sp. Yama58-4]